MELFTTVLLLVLLFNAVMVVCTRKLLSCVLIFMAQSLVMILLWILLQAPDLAITETAVGAGVSSLLFFLALKRIRALDVGENSRKSKADNPQRKGGVRRG